MVTKCTLCYCVPCTLEQVVGSYKLYRFFHLAEYCDKLESCTFGVKIGRIANKNEADSASM